MDMMDSSRTALSLALGLPLGAIEPMTSTRITTISKDPLAMTRKLPTASMALGTCGATSQAQH